MEMEKVLIQQAEVVTTLYAGGHACDGVGVDAFRFLSTVVGQRPYLDLGKPETDCPILASTYRFDSFEINSPQRRGYSGAAGRWAARAPHVGWR